MDKDLEIEKLKMLTELEELRRENKLLRSGKGIHGHHHSDEFWGKIEDQKTQQIYVRSM